MSSPRTTRAQQRSSYQEARAVARAREARRRRRMNVAVVVVMVVAFAGIAVLALRSPAPATDANGEVYVAQKEGFRLPGLLDDQPVSLRDHLGTPVVVNFFASWCVYCNQELPGFTQVARAAAGQIDFIGVNTDDPGDGDAMARRFDLEGAGFALARDIGPAPASSLWSRYGVQGLPITAFYDSQGRLVDLSGGALTQDQLQERIRANFGVDVSAAEASDLIAPVIPLIPRGAYELLATHAQDPAYLAIDLRSAAKYSSAHVPGAVNVQAESGSLPPDLTTLDKSGYYFLLDQSGEIAEHIADRMHAEGFKHVYFVQGGMVSWVQQGMPITS